jgi:hypothetical protein
VRNLNSLFEDEAPSKTMVYEWFAESNNERPTFDDDVREGRPCTSVVAKEVDAVREMILADRHVTYREIEASLGIAVKQIHSILHNQLHVTMLCRCWIVHLDNASAMQALTQQNELSSF